MVAVLLFLSIVGICCGVGILLGIICAALTRNPSDAKFRNENRT